MKKYEPFFTDTHHFDFARTIGESPTIFYDPLGRVVATSASQTTPMKL